MDGPMNNEGSPDTPNSSVPWSRWRKRQTRQTYIFTSDLRRLGHLGVEWDLPRCKVIERLLDAVGDPALHRVVTLPDEGWTRLEQLAERLDLSPVELVARVLHLATALSPGELGKLLLGVDSLPAPSKAKDRARYVMSRAEKDLKHKRRKFIAY